MNIQNKDLKKRILDISYHHKLSHLGSCLTAVDIINEIYAIKKPDEKFILSNGHAGLALYCVIEKYEGLNAEKIFNHHGVHPDRCGECHIDCSSGSLGMGLPIAVGMALADRKKRVYCLISDGECAEGSIFEALRIVETNELWNLNIYLNHNKWAAYQSTDKYWLPKIGPSFIHVETSVEQLPFLRGQDAHYKVMNEDEYKQALEILK
jgi:transketolase